jgi:hypothetical protein
LWKHDGGRHVRRVRRATSPSSHTIASPLIRRVNALDGPSLQLRERLEPHHITVKDHEAPINA